MFDFPSSTLNNAPVSIVPPMLMSKAVLNTSPASDSGILAMEQKLMYYDAKPLSEAKKIPDFPPIKVPTKEKQLVPEERRSTKPGLIRLPRAKKVKKQVHFQVDENDKIVQQEIYFKKAPKRNHCDLYFSRNEKKSIIHQAITQADTFRLDHNNVVSELECALSSCREEDVAPEEIEAANYLLLRKWSFLEMRGLEKIVSTMFCDDILSTVAGILGCQGYLKKAGTVSKSQQEELLRSYSEKLSSRSRVFAAKVGEADAFIAEHLYATSSSELEIEPL